MRTKLDILPKRYRPNWSGNLIECMDNLSN
jgi:hypothetical protein